MLALTPFSKSPVRRQSGNELMNFYNMFDDFFDDNFFNMRSLKNDTFKMDVKEQDQSYLIEAEMPGVKKEEIKLDYQDGQLLISVQKEENINDETDNYIHRERRMTSMQRGMMLKDINPKGIEASLEDGILKIVLPKLEPKSNKVQIQVK